MKGTWVTKGRGLTVGGGRAEAKPDSIPVSSFINRLAGQSTVGVECYINNKLYQGTRTCYTARMATVMLR